MSTLTIQRAKRTLSIAGTSIAFVVMLDLMILFTSLAQIAVEGRTGYWNPFWRAQAEVVLSLMK